MLTLDQIIKALLASEKTFNHQPPDECVNNSDARYKFFSEEQKGETDYYKDTCQNREHKERVYVFFPSDDPYCGKIYCCECLVENFNQ